MSNRCPNTFGNSVKHQGKLTDDQVRQARTMHEKEGKTIQECADHFGMELSYMKQICRYLIRSRIYID